jgi:nucleoid DNA-binding protein
MSKESFQRVIDEVAKELKVDKLVVKACITHCFNWVRERLISLEYPEILLMKLGTFKIIHKRLKNESQRNEFEAYYQTKKKHGSD